MYRAARPRALQERKKKPIRATACICIHVGVKKEEKKQRRERKSAVLFVQASFFSPSTPAREYTRHQDIRKVARARAYIYNAARHFSTPAAAAAAAPFSWVLVKKREEGRERPRDALD